jgi:aminoglycoside/choline kinase family phosphotransferase
VKPEQSEYLYVETLFKNSFSGSRTQIKTVQVSKMTGDASTRRYYRVTVEDDQEAYVVCLDHPSGEAENNFTSIQKILAENGCQVPRIFDQRLEKGYLLEEDLGNRTFLTEVALCRTADEEFDYYQRALDELIKIQSIDPSRYPKAAFNSYSFDTKKLMQEVRLTHEFFLQGYLNVEVTPVDAKILEEHFAEICRELSSRKMVLTHRDYHSRNIMMKNDHLHVIDFQDARLGIPQYDLVSLLEDCYYKVAASSKEKLKDYYWTHFMQKDYGAQTREEFEHYYDYMAIQRIYKAIGSFAYIYQTRSDTRYLKYIGVAFERLRHLLLKKNYVSLSQTLSTYYYDS